MTGAGRRLPFALLVALLLALAVAEPAGADPAGPTDYLGTIVEIDPSIDGLEVAVVGGDAFVELVNRTGAVVHVPGYENEPYLRFGADGVVQENERSPSTVLNRNRLPGDGEAQGEALAATDATAEPAWRVVARDGRYRWHDHRTHWMSPQPPLGRAPGDIILEGVLPLTVAEQAVSVRVEVRWVDPPPRWPAVLAGAVVAGSLVTAALVLRRRPGWELVVAAVGIAGAAALAALVSWRERTGLPPVAGPPVARLILAVVAMVAAAIAAVGMVPRAAPSRYGGVGFAALGLLAALELAVWGWLRRGGLAKPVLPIGPQWAPLDRISVATSLVVASAAALLFATELFRPQSAPASGPGAGEPAGSV
ncbi:MAG: hypothetical protein IT196_23710 [Acidimicrobiales bacterium]|nr:hypothetical protein [Acidimicrobiales bacterium]